MTPIDRVITRSELPTVLEQLAAQPGVRASVVKKITTPEGKSFELRDGGLVGTSDGSRYVIGEMNRGGFTLRREIPKVRGKAARKADRRARAEQRRRQFHVVTD